MGILWCTDTNKFLLKRLQQGQWWFVFHKLSYPRWVTTAFYNSRQFWFISCVVKGFLTNASSLNRSLSSVWMCWNACMSISSACCVCVHSSHQRGSWAGPHVNQSTRGRLFSREIIIVRDVRRRRSLVIFFLPCGAVKRSHPGRKSR